VVKTLALSLDARKSHRCEALYTTQYKSVLKKDTTPQIFDLALPTLLDI